MLSAIRNRINLTTHASHLAAQIEDAATALQQQQLESREVDRLHSIKARLNEGRLQIAVLGQFKRGKSSLINALLGAPVLPIAVVPLTAVPIFISWGQKSFARVTFSTGRSRERCESSEPKEVQEFLGQFVAEERNPHNRLCVERVDLAYPSAFLSNGIVLIDTPGVGSSHLHNTETALRILPECDAAIFVVSADPPITATEIDYLKQIKSKAARIVFIVNKMDYLDTAEQKLAIEFLRKVLSDHTLIRQSDEIVGISAREGLAAKLRNDPDALWRSGIQRVENDFLGAVTREKSALLERAVRRKATDIITQATAAIELRIKAVTLPLEELTSRAAKFEEALVGLNEQRRVLRDLLEGDRRGLVAALEEQIGGLRREARSILEAAISRALSIGEAALWEPNAKDAISNTIEELFTAARERFRKRFADEAGKALASHQNRLHELLDSIRHAAANAFDLSFPAEQPDQPFELGEDPYWVTDAAGATLPDTGRLLDRFVPKRLRRLRLQFRLLRQTDDLIVRNAENLRWAILRGIFETIGTAADSIEERLGDAVSTTKGVIDDVLARRRVRSIESEAQVSALREVLKVLGAICEEIRDSEHDRT
jgi:GTP-binding protein EngB required for normal cell division